MHALIVFCHPEPQSFNGALADITEQTLQAQGHSVERADLYQQGFDPVEGPHHYPHRADPAYFAALTEQRAAGHAATTPDAIRYEIERLRRADLVILQFPLWWHAQPAILKGWFDRVFVYGELYTGSHRYDRGIFRGKRAICSVTTGGPQSTFSQFGRGGAIERVLWPINYSLYYMGFDVLTPSVNHGVQGGGIAYQDQTQFAAHLEACKQAWRSRLNTLSDDAPIPFTGWGDWDTDGRIRADHPNRWLV